MSRTTDRFRMTEELGQRLRSLRKRAGLTQKELAGRVSPGWARSLVGKLETGEYENPGLRLVADYLRACRASFSEVADLLDQYTSQPLPVEKEGREAVNKVTEALPAQIGNQALNYDIKTTVARRFEGKPPLSSEERVKRVVNLAAAASRRKRLDILVKYLEAEVGHGLAATQRQYLNLLAKKFWGALSSTRGRLKHMRLRRMARVVGEGVAAHVLSEKDVRFVRDRVVELFSRMETTGAFGAVTPARPHRRPTALEREMRGITPEMLNRQVSVGMGVSAASAAVETRDRLIPERMYWNSWLTSLVSDAHDTLPGTPEREKVLAEALEKCKDKQLGRRFAALALDGLDRFLRRK
jgi:transcriptional regulator with XRE-family HTH domain